MSDEIEALHSRIIALRDEILATQGRLPVLQHTKPRVLALVAQKLTLFDQWLQLFPSDGQFWELPGSALQCFETAQKKLITLARVIEKRLGGSDPQTRMLWELTFLSGEVHEQMMAFIWSRHLSVPAESRSGFVLSARQVLQVLKIHYCPWYIDWVGPELEDEGIRLVRFHPYLTIQLIYNLIDALRAQSEKRNARGHLSRAITPDFFEVRITIQGVSLRPESWDNLYTMPGCLDALYDLGGHIEPLTWSDSKSQGQGVIVRLPWARS
jgi:hypothetical protein